MRRSGARKARTQERPLMQLLGVVGVILAAPAGAEEAVLRFEREGELVRALSREELVAGCDERRVAIDDPYYGRRKAFLACPLAQVIALGFGEAPSAEGPRHFFFRAKDGYSKPADEATLAEPGGFLAYADAEREEGFEPIDRRQVDPGPFYVVWTGGRDTHRHPWPYQLVTIEVAPFASEHPHTLPRGVPEGAPAWRGFAIFRRECVACHSINGEGGTVGPELNVPRSIAEYRPHEQIKAYVRDPESFRYTSMPSHEHLSDADLDALVAYFEAMSQRKRDPEAAAAGR